MWTADRIVNQFPGSSLIGFDSWKGLPKETEGVWLPSHHVEGCYQADKNVVVDRLKKKEWHEDPRFKLVDGWFKDTLTEELQESIGKVILVNVDVDIHSSTAEVLEFICPLLQPGTIIFFDDWKLPASEGEWGECLAWTQFVERHPGLNWKVYFVSGHGQHFMEIL